MNTDSRAGLGAWQVGLAGIVAAMAVEPMRWFWTLPLPLFALGLVVWLELLRRLSAERAGEGEALMSHSSVRGGFGDVVVIRSW